jgi:hypothetical protein
VPRLLEEDKCVIDLDQLQSGQLEQSLGDLDQVVQEGALGLLVPGAGLQQAQPRVVQPRGPEVPVGQTLLLELGVHLA